jgi:hypothetical protein
MTWHDKTNTSHCIGSIMKITMEELTIEEPGLTAYFYRTPITFLLNFPLSAYEI